MNTKLPSGFPNRILSGRSLSLLTAGALLGLPGGATAEIARRAGDFIDSMGLNTHLDDDEQFYNYADFGDLGIRHFRDNSPPDTARDGYRRLNDLYNGYGIRCNMCSDQTATTVLDRQVAMRHPMYESIEGINEPDINSERSYFHLQDDWETRNYAATIQYQNDLFAAINGDDATKEKKVLSPAMAYPERTRALRGSSFDWMAVHSYDSGLRPTAFLLDSTALPSVLLLNPPGGSVAPIVLTETGWRTPREGSETIPDDTGAKYVPRVMAECFKRGILRTYLFEMCDYPGTYNYGLIRDDGTKKPAYERLKNLITLLREGQWNTSGKVWENIPVSSPGELDYTMSAPNQSVHHLLLQKGDGVFYLLLWQEASSFNIITNEYTTAAPAEVKLAFNTVIANASVHNLASSAPLATYNAPRRLTVQVSDEIVVVKLSPDPNPTETHPAVSIVASDAIATASNSAETGEFRIFRTGNTSSPMTVNYRIDGSAVAGTHYQTLSGSVQIPSGASFAPLPVVPVGAANINGPLNVIATLTEGSYSIGPRYTTAGVKLLTGSDLADDFEHQSPQGWTAHEHSSLEITNSPTNRGNGALEWTYVKSGTSAWANEIVLTFNPPRDLGTVSKVLVRFAEHPDNARAPQDPNNAAVTVRQPIYFDMTNGSGASVSGGAGVIWFHLFNEPGYRTIELPLGSFPRGQVSSLKFYVNGENFTAGTYVWHIDDVTFLSDSDATLADFEDGSTENRAAQERSTLEVNSPGASAGWRSLKWTYHDNNVTQWDNQIYLHFPRPLDLTKKRKLVFRFHADSSNPASDVDKLIYFDLLNAGVSASGGAGVAKWKLAASTPGFHTVELDLDTFPRDKVTSLSFYVNGNDFAGGDHIWYMDSVSAH